MVVSFGDWGVYTAQAGRSKICYALSQPKDRLPKDLKRDPAYLFVFVPASDNVRTGRARPRLPTGTTATPRPSATPPTRS